MVVVRFCRIFYLFMRGRVWFLCIWVICFIRLVVIGCCLKGVIVKIFINFYEIKIFFLLEFDVC